MNSILNISAYKFVPLPDAPALRELLHGWATDLALKGTILLAGEGINLFLAAPEAGVRDFVARLHADRRFADIAPKESWSATQPFKKMLVKVKNEIIRMD
ncbi:MAG: sulfurtransferase, partial [Rhodoferax sp.]